MVKCIRVSGWMYPPAWQGMDVKMTVLHCAYSHNVTNDVTGFRIFLLTFFYCFAKKRNLKGVTDKGVILSESQSH